MDGNNWRKAWGEISKDDGDEDDEEDDRRRKMEDIERRGLATFHTLLPIFGGGTWMTLASHFLVTWRIPSMSTSTASIHTFSSLLRENLEGTTTIPWRVPVQGGGWHHQHRGVLEAHTHGPVLGLWFPPPSSAQESSGQNFDVPSRHSTPHL